MNESTETRTGSPLRSGTYNVRLLSIEANTGNPFAKALLAIVRDAAKKEPDRIKVVE